MSGPGRGGWSRRKSAGERLGERREAVLLAAARAAARAEGAVRVEAITGRAGIGRNTLYEMFREPGEAVNEARRRAAGVLEARLREALRAPGTPRESLRAVAAAWVAEARRQGVFAAALWAYPERGAGALHGLRTSVVAVLTEVLEAAHRAGTTGQAVEPVRLALALGAFEAAARLALGGATADAELAQTLSDVVIRAFR